MDKIYYDALIARVDTSCIMETTTWPDDSSKKLMSSHKDLLRLQRACRKIHKNFLPFIFKLVPIYISARGMARMLECLGQDEKENGQTFVIIMKEFGLIAPGIDHTYKWFNLVNSWE